MNVAGSSDEDHTATLGEAELAFNHATLKSPQRMEADIDLHGHSRTLLRQNLLCHLQGTMLHALGPLLSLHSLNGYSISVGMPSICLEPTRMLMNVAAVFSRSSHPFK